MRRINKVCDLSTTYKAEEERWEQLNPPKHDAYTSSKHKHYWSVKMQLLRCQGGLCAYTEELLCSPELYSDDKWLNGIYGYTISDKQARGDLDHFDSSLKLDRGWLWDNFFISNAYTNRDKKQKDIDSRLKPSDTFNPFDWFDYDIDTNRFVANPRLSPELQTVVTQAITDLGINAIAYQREQALKGYKACEEYGGDIEVAGFPTAWAFWLQKRANHITDLDNY